MQTHMARVTRPRPSRKIGPAAGFLGYLATGLVFLVGGFHFVPGLWLLPMWASWLVGLWMAYRLMAAGSGWSLAAAPIALVFLWAYVAAGWALWGWVVEDLPINAR
jgi:hypothetical protein